MMFEVTRPAAVTEAEFEAAVLRAATEILGRRLERDGYTNPREVMVYLAAQLRDREQEVFAAMFLDTRHRLLAFSELFFGSIDSCTVHPREVVKAALSLNASAVVLTHNHPSGVAEPSAADVAITRRLVDALALVDVRVLDHIVVGRGECASLATLGLM